MVQLHGKQMSYFKKQLYHNENSPKLEWASLGGSEFPMIGDVEKRPEG